MAHLYIALGIDPEKILPGSPHKTQSELWDSDGIWTYVEYEAQRRTTEDVTIVYKVFVDWTLTNPYNESGKQKAAKLRADFGFNPLKTVEETIILEKLNRNAISGNDMSSSGNDYDMAPMSIDPKYATAYAAHDAHERMIVRWLNRHKEQISTLISDIVSISQGAVDAKHAKSAEELMQMARGTKEFAEVNKIIADLQKSMLSLKSEIAGFEDFNRRSLKILQQAEVAGTESKQASRLTALIAQADDASKMANDVDRIIYQPVKPATPRTAKLPSSNVEAQIEATLKNSAQRAVNEVAATANKGTRIATAEEMAVVKAVSAATNDGTRIATAEEMAVVKAVSAATNDGTRIATATEMAAVQKASKFGQAAKWLKRAGYVGLALQAGCVLLNGIFVLLSEEGDERNNAMQTFADSAGSFGISLGMYLGAAAIGGPVGLAIGIGLAVIDIALLAGTGKSSADYIWDFVKYTLDMTDGGRRLMPVISMIRPIGL